LRERPIVNERLNRQLCVTTPEAASVLDDTSVTTKSTSGRLSTIADIATGVVRYRFFALPIERPTLLHLEARLFRRSERKPRAPGHASAFVTACLSMSAGRSAEIQDSCP
jgi:hypothetical protein